jgi:hypothetical protein
MNMPNDFFAKRLAAIEQEKARRLAPIEENRRYRECDSHSRCTSERLHAAVQWLAVAARV